MVWKYSFSQEVAKSWGKQHNQDCKIVTKVTLKAVAVEHMFQTVIGVRLIMLWAHMAFIILYVIDIVLCVPPLVTTKSAILISTTHVIAFPFSPYS